MMILGISGGFEPEYESVLAFEANFVHDAAAVLIKDGEVVAAIEEERLNRIKHTNKFGTQAIRFCLQSAGVDLSDLDAISIYASEDALNHALKQLRLQGPEFRSFRDARGLCQDLFDREFGYRPRDAQMRFVHHHFAHAATSFYMSGYPESLVLSVDGAGDDISTMVADVRNKNFEVLMTKPIKESLGFFYLDVIRFLGYRIFDEYKVMGLAPYGRPETYRSLFESFYDLLPGGDYTIHKDRILDLYSVLEPRGCDEPFQQVHMDIAAAVQEALERIVFHLLEHYRGATGHEYLSLAGGVAQNSSMNGRILRSGLFKDVFAPSFAADQGCALGAALYVAHNEQPDLPLKRFTHSNWGTSTASNGEVHGELEQWDDFLDIRKPNDLYDEVAELIAGGAVIGWVQGKSEFGPRALGNRSILADPRLASHKDTINEMIKKRENYRPFAPSVLQERVHEFFEVPGNACDFPFMSFVLQVREEMHEKLAAITHVDGTARLQTVSRQTNPRYWALINAFGNKTGVSMLLNTSFNNNAEPIVDSVSDAVVCYLTSGLHYLVVDDYLVEKRPIETDTLLELVPAYRRAARLLQEDHFDSYDTRKTDCWIVWNYDESRRHSLQPGVFEILRASDGSRSVSQLIDDLGILESRQQIADSMFELWSQRFITLRPQRLRTFAEERTAQAVEPPTAQGI